jgi:hypothetical protein
MHATADASVPRRQSWELRHYDRDQLESGRKHDEGRRPGDDVRIVINGTSSLAYARRMSEADDDSLRFP